MKFYSSFPITLENTLANRALSYGDGLFETILVVNGQVPLWGLHYQRLSEGLNQLDLEGLSKEFLSSKILSLVNNNGIYIAKLVVFRDEAKRGYGSQSRQSQFFISINRYQKPTIYNNLTVSVVTLSKQKRLAGLKHLNRLEQVLAAQELNNSEYTDAIMMDNKQRVIETISKNIVLIKGNKLFTPKLNKCGVYGVALRWLEQQGFELTWKKIEFTSLQKYDGMMVCNSVQGFTTIANIGNKIQYSKPIDIGKTIQQKWEEYVNK